ncbi:hypothetical protein J4G08_04940 [Candidatus Poribacteria bacterium]|nr:hypothetical protein [Candidatus Poribacteria bacterium]
MTLWNEPISDGEPLLISIVKDGNLVYNFPNLTDIQTRVRSELSKLQESHKVLTDAKPYTVEIHLH